MKSIIQQMNRNSDILGIFGPLKRCYRSRSFELAHCNPHIWHRTQNVIVRYYNNLQCYRIPCKLHNERDTRDETKEKRESNVRLFLIKWIFCEEGNIFFVRNINTWHIFIVWENQRHFDKHDRNELENTIHSWFNFRSASIDVNTWAKDRIFNPCSWFWRVCINNKGIVYIGYIVHFWSKCSRFFKKFRVHKKLIKMLLTKIDLKIWYSTVY